MCQWSRLICRFCRTEDVVEAALEFTPTLPDPWPPHRHLLPSGDWRPCIQLLLQVVCAACPLQTAEAAALAVRWEVDPRCGPRLLARAATRAPPASERCVTADAAPLWTAL